MSGMRASRAGQVVLLCSARPTSFPSSVVSGPTGRASSEWEEVTLEARTPNICSSPMVEEALAEREAALERWHERRALAGEREIEAQAVLVEALGSGRTMVGRSSETSERWGANGPAA